MLAQDRKRYLKLIAHLAWPTILEQTLSTLVSYVDTAMVGRLGTQATAAVLRCKDQVMRDVETVQENCSDILADARAINEARAAEEAKYIEDTSKA